MSTTKPHGTPARYDHGTPDGQPPCREACCREAKAAARRLRDRLRAYGRSPMTSAEPARRHIAALRAAGMGHKQITRRARVSKDLCSRVERGQKTIHVDIAQRLLAVTVDGPLVPREASCYTSAVGTSRRIQALVAAGWTLSAVAAEAGLSRGPVEALAREERATVKVGTAAAIKAATGRMWERQPPARTRAERRNRAYSLRVAAERNWAPFAAWDNDIDDPDAKPMVDAPPVDDAPDPHLALAAVAGRLRLRSLPAADAEYVVTRLRDAGRDKYDIADLLGCTAAEVAAVRERVRARELRAERKQAA